MIENIYRVVTGHDGSGESLVAAYEEVRPIEVLFQPGITFWQVWGTPDSGPVIGGVAGPDLVPFFPVAHGTRVGIVRFAPEKHVPATEVTGSLSQEALIADSEAKLPGLFGAHDNGMSKVATHATRTFDYGLVLDGEIHLQLDQGQEVRDTLGIIARTNRLWSLS
jgi:hypothetical protein